MHQSVLSVERSRYAVFLFSAGLVAVLVAHLGGLIELVARWSGSAEYSHGFFIPLIAAWALWERRGALAESIGNPSPWVIPIFAVSTVALIVGELTALYLLIHGSVILSLLGLVLAFGGFPLLRICALPLLYMGFAIPLPYFLEAELTWQLQLVSSEIGVLAIRLLGMPVFLSGNVIDLGFHQLEVVEACAGLRYLYPLLSLGALAAYMYQGALWSRILVLLSTIPITVLFNSLRLSIIAVTTKSFGIAAAEGWVHDFEGFVMFFGCAAMLMAEMWLLAALVERRPLFDILHMPAVKGVGGTRSLAAQPPTFFFGYVLALAGVLVATLVLAERDEATPPREDFQSFPRSIGEWVGEHRYLKPNVTAQLQFDDYLYTDYRAQNGDSQDPVNLYVAYYASQRKGESPHSPRVCIPGGGWAIDSIERTQIPASKDAQETRVIHLNRAIISMGRQRQLVYYWFRQRGRNMANEYLMKWYLLSDALTMSRTDGALVRYTTLIRSDESDADADARIRDILYASEPLFDRFIPARMPTGGESNR